MYNPPSKIQNLKSKIPTYLPLPDAARKYGLPEQALTQLIEAGKIEAVQLPSGEILVPDNNQKTKTKEEIIAEEFDHLRGRTINAYTAQKEYNIHHKNFLNWARAGYIRIHHEEEHLVEMDAADVAYCAYIYKQKKTEYGGRLAGVRLFDEEGNPYQVKYPDLSARRRR
jgi:hypothetical protein